jgi:hypothetical protein
MNNKTDQRTIFNVLSVTVAYFMRKIVTRQRAYDAFVGLGRHILRLRQE